ncbi:hypothetical protein ACWGQ5_30350 [Streptomyces sp. NPDC055722]|jgi:ketoreductase RED1
MSAHIGQWVQQPALGQPSQDPEHRERVVQAVKKAYASTPYTDSPRPAAHGRRQFAILSALDDIRQGQHQIENER